MISVIYPLFNETASDWFLRNLQKFKILNQNSLFDFVFVDGGSSDKTVELCKEAGFNPICLPQSTRSGRLKEGLKHSKGEMVLFHHPRSFISNEGWEELQNVVGKVCWGGFTHKFDIKGPLFKFTSWYSNQVRLKVKGVVYLDHCLFFHQSLLNPEEIMDVPIFEDTLISYKLREKRSPLLLKGTSTTSSIRFKRNGFLNQVLKNQKAKVQFHWKKNFRSINKDYELGLNLNNNEDHIKKFQNPLLTAKGEERASVELSELKTLWFNTGSLCNLECTNCYIESSPKNDRLQYLNINDLTKFLDETKMDFKKLELVGFTGGEPFLNPNITTLINETLKRGYPLLILTNAFRVLKRHKKELIKIKEKYGDGLKIRVSLDHYTQKFHEKERGPDTFYKTLEEVRWLSENAFCLSLAGRSLLGEDLKVAHKGYMDLLHENDINWNLSPEKLAIFPEMDLKKAVPEITTECWNILNISPEDQMCSTERMIVHRKGRDLAEVMPCTLLAYQDQFSLGTSLKSSEKRVPLNHPFCAQFCVLGGASCSAQK